MPLGSLHDEAGLVLDDDQGPTLRRDDGGVWRLDGPSVLRQLVGRRVRLRGRRIGFDLLSVETADGEPLREPRPAVGYLGGVFVTLLGLAALAVGLFGW